MLLDVVDFLAFVFFDNDFVGQPALLDLMDAFHEGLTHVELAAAFVVVFGGHSDNQPVTEFLGALEQATVSFMEQIVGSIGDNAAHLSPCVVLRRSTRRFVLDCLPTGYRPLRASRLRLAGQRPKPVVSVMLGPRLPCGLRLGLASRSRVPISCRSLMSQPAASPRPLAVTSRCGNLLRRCPGASIPISTPPSAAVRAP